MARNQGPLRVLLTSQGDCTDLDRLREAGYGRPLPIVAVTAGTTAP